MKDAYGVKPAPDDPKPKSKVAQEVEAREAAGWVLKPGFPVVFNENYVVGSFTYYCNISTTPTGSVWRIPTKDLP